VTRRSKRELKRIVEDLAGADPTERPGETLLKQRCTPEVVAAVRGVVLNLVRAGQRATAEGAGSGDGDADAVDEYLDAVTDRYGLEADRRDGIKETLLDTAQGKQHRSPDDVFTWTVPSVAARLAPETDDGPPLAALVDAGDKGAAEQLLVQRTYDVLAEVGAEVAP